MDPVKILCFIFSVWLGELCVSAKWLPDDDISWLKIRTRILYPKNFASVRINSHNERELRVSFGKVLALETFMSSGYSPDYDMILRQITDGRRILQAVYQGGVMKECDYSKDSTQMLDFVSNFMSSDYHGEEFGDIVVANMYSNYTRKNIMLAYRSFKSLDYLKDLSEVVDMRLLRKECRNFLAVATSVAEEEAKSGNFTDIYAEILDNTDPEKFSEFNKELSAQNSNSETQTASTSEHNISKRSTAPLKRKRAKRAAFDFSSVLIFPGTKWCGKGDLAQCYDDLGDDHELDACCRDHDCCPFMIPPFSNKYGIFNYRFHSLIHCDCDQRFRGCLRQSVSSMANMIGKIYFNILGSKCFDFQETEVCAERSWWGRCQRYENQTIAAVKSQVSFIDKDGNEDYAVVENQNESRK
ncbi:uncharacterized protein LOC123534282 [Mercenaria mercenaria]|uniref:uncharacterized protein LOC123534282 n=1 Tax=Mercenaria mercenaria TaxID=6596 RepID=UPI00234F0FD9|nr:uncharacterized protein LOC123534282 [Mercenaria mercenaria]